ncbi:MAG: ABC transporter ATP-binding protein [Clostridia bacterium]|nr:ABC transporter ATP-binding protein [Clostridia bacterium]
MDLMTCEGMKKRYGTHEVLKGVDITVRPDRIVGLLGKNGAGKSTLFKLMNDLLVPDEGRILFRGEPIGEKSKARISYLPERTYLDRDMKISGALRFFAEFYGDFSADRARELLRELELDGDMRIRKMSKGMQEKLQLILVMSREADLYLLDEPLGGVDPSTRETILDTILSNFREGASLVISTHMIAEVERILDEVVILKDGVVAVSGAADELREREMASIDEIFRRTVK